MDPDEPAPITIKSYSCRSYKIKQQIIFKYQKYFDLISVLFLKQSCRDTLVTFQEVTLNLVRLKAFELTLQKLIRDVNGLCSTFWQY